MIKIEWSDGSVMVARSYVDLLAKIGALPWHQDFTPTELRDELAKRAYNWSFTVVNPEAPAREFIRGLAKAKMLRFVTTTRKRKEDRNA